VPNARHNKNRQPAHAHKISKISIYSISAMLIRPHYSRCGTFMGFSAWVGEWTRLILALRDFGTEPVHAAYVAPKRESYGGFGLKTTG
jgi:hypothetical protein